MRLRKPLVAVTVAALAAALSACGDPIKGGVTWFVRPGVSQRLLINSAGQEVLHVVLSQLPLGDNFPGHTAGVVFQGSSFREDCSYTVPEGTKLPVPLQSSLFPGVCTLALHTGYVASGQDNKFYVASGKATGVYGNLPSLSGSGTLDVRQALINGLSADTPTNVYLRITAAP